jgi:hypothetical protein
MNHKCKQKGCECLEYFRYEKITKNGLYMGMAYGSYGKCRKCSSLVKICVMTTPTGQIREMVLQIGESKKTKNGEISFTEEEAEKIKEKYERQTVSQS